MTSAEQNSAITLIRKAFRSGGTQGFYGSRTFAARRSAKATDYRGYSVIIPRRSTSPVKVQGIPDQLPLLTNGEADCPAAEVAVEQVVADTELIVHEGRVAIQDICCGQQELGFVQPRCIGNVNSVGGLRIDGGPRGDVSITNT